MDIAVVLVLLCTAAPGAHSTLPDVDMTAPPEATSALALLSPFLATHKSTLLVVGQVNWTRAFLWGLSTETSWVLIPDERAQSDQYLKNFGVNNNCTALVVTDKPTDLYTWMGRRASLVGGCRFLFWVTLRSDKQLALPKVLSYLLCIKPTGLAVTSPNGSTTLYTVVPKYCVNGSLKLVEVDRWSSADQSWQGADVVFRVFDRFCSRWRPPVAEESLTIYVIRTAKEKRLPEYFKTIRSKIVNLPWKVNLLTTSYSPDNYLTDTITEVWQRIDHCKLFAAFIDMGDPKSIDPKKISALAEKGMFEISAFVPAGFGPVANPLDAIRVEFSPAVWMGTALAALSTAAALACIIRRDRGAALLLALAPLLGQAPGTPPPAGRALRPLLGVWLLVCVVLVAAYQGLLLGELSTTRAPGEINSLRELSKTGLPIYVALSAVNLLETELLSDFDLHKIFAATNVGKALQHVAQYRNCAMIAIQDRTLRRLLQPLTIPQKKVHAFGLVAEFRRVFAVWSPGSPLGELSRATHERLDEAGILDHWENKLDEGNKVALGRYLLSLQQERALTLKHVAPAFYVLFIGLTLATLVLGVELATGRWCGAGRRTTPARWPAGSTRLSGGQDVLRCRPAAAMRLRARGGPLDPRAGGRRAPDIPLVQLHGGPRRTAWQ
ncbi:Ionotropic receptor 163 [Frankliniella occidentalis]|nr:Ionotropic receptor 163 [Frankliniella occidentalis]